jgi:tetratricopeptide (TPR) repeat protein
MSKKTKRSRQSIGNIAKPQHVEEYLILIHTQIARSDYAGVIDTGQKLLGYLPKRSEEYAEILGYIGTSHAKMRHFPQAYDAFTEALSIQPDNAYFWFNRGVIDEFVGRLGQSVRDLERAVELLFADPSDPLARDAEKALKRSMKDAQKAMKERGRNFTLDQLIEQESLNLHGLELARAQKWEEAEQTFRRIIALGDCYPQPWGNLGVCLLKQQRYDEAEAAWKRALAIDWRYSLARTNLKALERIRRGEDVPTGRLVELYEGDKVKKKLILDEGKSEK